MCSLHLFTVHTISWRSDYGPCVVEKRIGSVRIIMFFQRLARFIRVFYVSRLKKVVSPKHQVLPALHVDDPTLQVSFHVLHHLVKQIGHKIIVQVLVQWSNSDASATTWEDLNLLKQKFPRAPT
jgi:hypothetical protein